MLQTCVAGILLVLSYVSIFHMISMLSSSKTTSAVVCILAAVFMMVFAGIIFSKLSQPEMITQAVIANGETVMETVKNPAYLTGISRTVYQNILDFLPAGQAVQIFNQGVLNLGKMMGMIADGIPAQKALEQAIGTYGRYTEAARTINPRKQ